VRFTICTDGCSDNVDRAVAAETSNLIMMDSVALISIAPMLPASRWPPRGIESSEPDWIGYCASMNGTRVLAYQCLRLGTESANYLVVSVPYPMGLEPLYKSIGAQWRRFANARPFGSALPVFNAGNRTVDGVAGGFAGDGVGALRLRGGVMARLRPLRLSRYYS
jgi:hypothetical protein